MNALRSAQLPARTVLVAAVLPILATLVGVVLMLAWLPELPQSVAVHWGPDATADGYVPAWAAPVLLAVVGIGVPLTLTAVLRLPSSGRFSAEKKFAAVTSLWAGVFLTLVLTWTLGAQRGLEDATAAPGPLWPLLGGFLVALAAAAGAWFLLPPSEKSEGAAGRTPDALPLAADERAVWSRRVSAPSGYLMLSGAVVLLLVGMAITVSAVTDGRLWFLALLPVALFAVFATTAVWHVRIDARGAAARGLLGVPRFTVPLSDIRSARVVTVDPLGDFGGWGFRWGGGRRFGIVLGAGEALEIERLDGRSFVITTGDAERAAALVNGMRARATLGS
ncbi:MAG: DUF1648 domain-containing protein [Actinomycetota bacterium]|nr:DUF1648 domain-containing protein [Actinomycetota bacterium]